MHIHPPNAIFLHTDTLPKFIVFLSSHTRTIKGHSLTNTLSYKLQLIFPFTYIYFNKFIYIQSKYLFSLCYSLRLSHVSTNTKLETLETEANIFDIRRKLKDVGNCRNWWVELKYNTTTIFERMCILLECLKYLL